MRHETHTHTHTHTHARHPHNLTNLSRTFKIYCKSPGIAILLMLFAMVLLAVTQIARLADFLQIDIEIIRTHVYV